MILYHSVSIGRAASGEWKLFPVPGKHWLECMSLAEGMARDEHDARHVFLATKMELKSYVLPGTGFAPSLKEAMTEYLKQLDETPPPVLP